MFRCTQSIGWFSATKKDSKGNPLKHSLTAGKTFDNIADLDMSPETVKRFKYEKVVDDEKKSTILTSESFVKSAQKPAVK